MHRALETLRAAMNWGMAQTPPMFNRTPFHRFGVRLNKKAETSRDRRLTRDEEKRLLDAALHRMNGPEHRYTGPILHDRIIGALELCCRRGEMLLIQNKRVNWETCQIGIPGATAKDRENRRHSVQPEWTARGDSRTARHAWSRRVRLRRRERRLSGEHSDRVGDASASRAWHRAEAKQRGGSMEPRATPADRPALARPQARRREPVARGWRRHPNHPADARTREHPADATLPERDGRGTQEGTGGELEQQGPTASTGVRKLIGPVVLPDCPRFVPGTSKCGCGGTQPAEFGVLLVGGVTDRDASNTTLSANTKCDVFSDLLGLLNLCAYEFVPTHVRLAIPPSHRYRPRGSAGCLCHREVSPDPIAATGADQKRTPLDALTN